MTYVTDATAESKVAETNDTGVRFDLDETVLWSQSTGFPEEVDNTILRSGGGIPSTFAAAAGAVLSNISGLAVGNFLIGAMVAGAALALVAHDRRRLPYASRRKFEYIPKSGFDKVWTTRINPHPIAHRDLSVVNILISNNESGLETVDSSSELHSPWVGYADLDLGGTTGLRSAWLGTGDELSASGLNTENVYTRTAIENFIRLNTSEFRSFLPVLRSVVGIINYFLGLGYRPVVTVDEEDNLLEIEARLDPNQLLILQVQPTGAVEGLISNDTTGIERINATGINEVLNWLVSGESVDESFPSIR